MPFPSLACGTCKKRRVKCDETQPICLRCTKSRRQCQGMKTSLDSIVHIENEYASGTRKRPRGPRPQSPKSPSLLPNQPQLVADLTTQAISYYLHHHVQPLHDAPSITKGIEDDIELIYTSRPDSSTIKLAISVIALVLFGKTQGHPQAIVDACARYQTLLQKIQNSVSSPTERNVEECLFAIFCMGRYEDTVHSSTQPLTQLWAFRSSLHHDGALAVLYSFKNRRDRDRDLSSASTPLLREKENGFLQIPDLVKHTRRGMIKSAIMRKLALPEWIRNGQDFGEDEDLEIDSDRMLVKLVDLRYRISCLQKFPDQEAVNPATIEAVETIVKECQDLDSELSAWPTHFPSSWARHEHIHLVAGRETKRYTYHNLAFASIWSKYYATRMLLHSALINALNLSNSLPDPQPNATTMISSRETISEMSQCFQSSLPFCLGHADLSLADIKEEQIPQITIRWLAWPLSMCMFADEVDEVDKSVFVNELVRLGRRVGIGVLKVAGEVTSSISSGDGWGRG